MGEKKFRAVSAFGFYRGEVRIYIVFSLMCVKKFWKDP